MPRPGIPEKAIKSLSARNKRDLKKNNKKDLAKRIGALITSNPLCSWVPNSMTLPLSSYHARAVTFGCMAKGKGVSSRANLIISMKVLVGNTVSSGFHAKAVSSS
jgi:hypothetical protein